MLYSYHWQQPKMQRHIRLSQSRRRTMAEAAARGHEQAPQPAMQIVIIILLYNQFPTECTVLCHEKKRMPPSANTSKRCTTNEQAMIE